MNGVNEAQNILDFAGINAKAVPVDGEGVSRYINGELGLPVRIILNEDGSISINAEDAAIGLGWTQSKNGNLYVRWDRVNDFLADFSYSPLVGKISPQVGKGDYIPEALFYMLAMKANNEAALKFQKWIAMEVIPSIRKTGGYTMRASEPEEVHKGVRNFSPDDYLTAARIVSDCPDDRLHIINSILRQGGFPIPESPAPFADEWHVYREREEWAAEVKARMFKLGITNKALASEVGLNETYLSMLVNGSRVLSDKGKTDTVSRIFAALDRLEKRAGLHDTVNTPKKQSVSVSFDWEKLLRFMNNRSIRVKTLAEKTGIDSHDITAYRHGKAVPNGREKRRLCKELGVEETYFDKTGSN